MTRGLEKARSVTAPTIATPMEAALRPELPHWLPPLLILVQLSVHFIDRDVYDRCIESEDGLVENATVIICVLAVIGGVLVFRRRHLLPHRLLGVWIALVGLGTFYFGGEEISWGQHLGHWGTPEPLAAINDQGETNIHNISSWFDQKPRLLLELWVLFGGIFYAAWRALRPGHRLQPADWRYWFWPTSVCIPVSVLAILIRMGERLNDWFSVPIPPALEIRASEPQEYCFALFLLFYLWSLHARLRAQPPASEGKVPRATTPAGA